VGAIPFEAKPARYLLVMVAAPTKLPATTASGPDAGVAGACAQARCTLASGWVEIR
jgi:hypothetical protein